MKIKKGAPRKIPPVREEVGVVINVQDERARVEVREWDGVEIARRYVYTHGFIGGEGRGGKFIGCWAAVFFLARCASRFVNWSSGTDSRAAANLCLLRFVLGFGEY